MPPFNITKALGSTMVHIKVGKEQQDFCLHKDLICHYSQYFTNGFTGGLEESMTNIMKLPGVEVEVFKLFQGWLYTQVVFNNLADQADWPKTNDLMKLYVFADMARISTLKNECIEAINLISSIEEAFPVESIPYVYENTQKGSLIRCFIVDSLTWEHDPDTFAQIADHLIDEVRLEAMIAMRKVIYTSARPGAGKLKKMASPLNNLKNYYEYEVKFTAKTPVKTTTKAAVKAPVKASNASPNYLCSSPVEPAAPPAEPPSSPVREPISQLTGVPESPRTKSPLSPVEASKPLLARTLARLPTSSPDKLHPSLPFEPIVPVINAKTRDSVEAVKNDMMDIVKGEITAEIKVEMKEEVMADVNEVTQLELESSK